MEHIEGEFKSNRREVLNLKCNCNCLRYAEHYGIMLSSVFTKQLMVAPTRGIGLAPIKYMLLETARHPGRKCTGHERSRSWYLVSIQLVFYLSSGKLEYPNKIIRFKTSIVRMKMNPCEEIRRR